MVAINSGGLYELSVFENTSSGDWTVLLSSRTSGTHNEANNWAWPTSISSAAPQLDFCGPPWQLRLENGRGWQDKVCTTRLTSPIRAMIRWKWNLYCNRRQCYHHKPASSMGYILNMVFLGGTKSKNVVFARQEDYMYESWMKRGSLVSQRSPAFSTWLPGSDGRHL